MRPLSANVGDGRAVGASLTAGGIVLSTLWFVRVMRQAGPTVRFNQVIVAGGEPVTP